MPKYKQMTVQDAVEWIEIYASVFGNGPTSYGKPDVWLIRAGQMCRDRFVNRGSRPPVTDEAVRKSLNVEPEPEGVLL